MVNWFMEFLLVLSYSRRTQVALVLSVVSFFGALLLGEQLVSGVELHGPLAPLTGVLQDKLLHRYDKLAWFGLLSFLGLAVKLFQKDRKRLLQSY